MADKSGASRESNLDRQLEMYRHHKEQAQKFLRTVLAGVAVFGVSIGTAILTSWKTILDLLPTFNQEVAREYNLDPKFVEATNNINFLFASLAVIVAFLMALDAAKFMIRVLRTEPIIPDLENGNNYDINHINNVLIKQSNLLNEGYKLAKWSVPLGIAGGTLVTVAITGRADLLAIVDLLITIISFTFIFHSLPQAIFFIIDKAGDMKSIVNEKGYQSLWQIRGNQDEVVSSPDFLVFMFFTLLWTIYFLYGGLVGFLWWLGAFQTRVNQTQTLIAGSVFCIFLIVILANSLIKSYRKSNMNINVRQNIIRLKEEI